jgi:ParB family chromosome partitioning protein
MATAIQKIALSASRDIPFNKLLLSSCNVRRIKADVSIQELADDIARRTLLQSITVRPVLDAEGQETGMFEVPAGGRRYRALELLVKQKRLARIAPIPCVIRTDGIAEEDSLAENVQRAPLHPLDQFRAFLALREKGQSEEEIAAAFFVSVAVVKQRLRLASVSPKLLDLYGEDGITLDQLMAFTVSGDWQRQEQVFERLASSYSREPYAIRRLLTEGAVRASDKRARFIGLEAYEAAGGRVMRDLFQGDDGGWLQDVALVDRLVAEGLEREAETVRAEGWRWIEVAPDFPYGHTFRLRQLRGEDVPVTAEEEAERAALQAEYDRLEEAHADQDLPEEVERRLTEIEARLSALDERPALFAPAEIARAGAFVSIDGDGQVLVERGYVRPEDELPVAPEPDPEAGGGVDSADADATGTAPAAAMPVRVGTEGSTVHAGPAPLPEPEEDEGIRPLPDRLLAELTTHRTLALRHALGEQPDVAFLAALHALCLRVFYSYTLDTCLDLDLKSVAFAAQAPGLKETPLARTLTDRHQSWLTAMPKHPEALWGTLSRMGESEQRTLFAHCIGLSVNAVHDAYNRRPKALAHADVLAQAVRLDMASAGWTPTVDTYLGRVTKARILQAVREAKGDEAAERIAQLKKGDMAEEAQGLLAGSG